MTDNEKNVDIEKATEDTTDFLMRILGFIDKQIEEMKQEEDEMGDIDDYEYHCCEECDTAYAGTERLANDAGNSEAEKAAEELGGIASPIVAQIADAYDYVFVRTGDEAFAANAALVVFDRLLAAGLDK